MKKISSYFKRCIKILLALAVIAAVAAAITLSESREVFLSTPVDEEIKLALNDYFKQRCQALVAGDPEPIKSQFDLSTRYGKWSYEISERRIKYARDWSATRGLTFRECETKLKIFSIKGSSSAVKIYLNDITRMAYTYDNEMDGTLNEFAIGTNHTMNLVKKDDGTWLITVDWFNDPMDDSMPQSSPVPTISTENEEIEVVSSGWVKYDRAKAVEYADKYCGANFYIDEGYKYNKKYRNFAPLGGDCANFASQVLSDKEAGSIKMGGGWHYKNGEASAAWVNAGAFTKNMLHSGRGKLVSRGKYQKVVNFTKYIAPGDFIAYERKGDIVHVSVVTAIDSAGVPLVNSHTNDRYHVPWDLGWNSDSITFWLVRING